MMSGFEWDDLKAELNLRKHGLSFVAAGDVFLDPDRIEVDASRSGMVSKGGRSLGQSTANLLRWSMSFAGRRFD
jgi:uncharacterized DUF497 family protein